MLNIDDRLISETAAKIKPNALAVLLAIAIHLNYKTGRAFPSNERLQKLTGLGRDAVTAALSVLRKNNLLESSQVLDKGGKFGRREFMVTTRFISIFVHAEDAEPLTENPLTVNPQTVEPSTGNTCAELIKEESNGLIKKELINKKEQLAGTESPQANFVAEDEDLKKGPSTGPGPLRVTIIEGHQEIIKPARKNKASQPKSDGVIQAMVTVFEEQHKIHFRDIGDQWIGFTWQDKEFPALNSIKKELQKRYVHKMNAEPTPENIVESWRMFLERAVKCDKYVLENLFTPSKLWGQFQSIIQKIHSTNGSTNGQPKQANTNDRNERNRIALANMVKEFAESGI